jgi:hypothetical protein
MNILGILIMYAMVIALYGDASGDKNKEAPKEITAKTTTVNLAEERLVSTDPVFIHLDGKDIRLINPAERGTYSKYYAISESGASTNLIPIPGASASNVDILFFLSGISRTDNHVIILMHESGVESYAKVRQMVAKAGIESGWYLYQGKDIRFGPGGQSLNSVQ